MKYSVAIILLASLCYNDAMFLVGLLSWWYGRGWQQRVGIIWDGLHSTAQTFSIGQLFKTLLAPFRQISAGGVRGSAAQQMQALFDQTISRLVGMVVRLMAIIGGGFILLIKTVAGGILLVAWPLIPLLPFVGVAIFLLGWVPGWI